MNYRLSQPEISVDEISAVTEVLKSEFFGMGKKVAEFENELMKFFKSNVLCTSTGTSALQLALLGVGVKPGDEVLVPSITYIATYQAISATGAIPVSCDIDSNTLQIDTIDAQNRITPKTKVIMPVYFSGATNCLEAVHMLSYENNLRVVADAAHAFGSMHKNKLIGSFGDVICFSFDGVKNITSGEGGCVVTKNLDVAEKIQDLRLLGVIGDSTSRKQSKRTWEFNVEQQGWRYHMSDIFAAIGIVQLSKLEIHRLKRQMLFNRYIQNFCNTTLVSLFDWSIIDGMLPHIFVLRIPGLKNRDLLRSKLDHLGISTGVHYKPNHLLSYYKTSYSLPKAEAIYPELLTLPLHTRLEIRDIDYISESLLKILESTHDERS